MPLYIRTDKDPDGTQVVVEKAFRGNDGREFLLLKRLPPHYAKPPVFVVELTPQRVERRGAGEREDYYRALAYQSFTPKEIEFLRAREEGKDHLPFFNFSYPNVMKQLGKKFYCCSPQETQQRLGRRFKLVGGDR